MNDFSVALSRIPRLSETDLEAAAAQSESDCVIDAVYPGRPLIISFNYFTQHNTFDLFGRIRKLEEKAQGPFNRIFLRDSHDCWYQRGIKGLGKTVDDVAINLHRLIKYINPSEVITIGQSMGGYAAILFGILLQADRAIGFGPLSHLNEEWTRRDGDVRWLPLIEQINAAPPMHWYRDLVALAKSQPILPVIHIVAGTHPEGNYSLPNMDKLHTARYATVPAVILHEYPEAKHEVSLWLLEKNLLDDVLYRTIVEPVTAPVPRIDVACLESGTVQYSTVRYAQSNSLI